MSLYLRDSRHASNLYGFTGARLNTGTPRFKFQFFIEINFNSAASAHVNRFLGSNARKSVYALVKNATLPNLSINTTILNQYNRKRVVQTKIEPQPISLTFHDTVDGQTLRLWEMYYDYYYRDGRNSDSSDIYDVVRSRFNDNFGYDIERVRNQRNLIKSIEITQVHGGRFSRVRAMSPTVTSFNHDTLEYSASGDLVEFRLEFQPEYIVYKNKNSRLSNDALERYERGDFWEMFDFLRTANPVGEVNTSPDEISEFYSGSLPISSGQVSNIERSLNVSRLQQPIEGIRSAPLNTIQSIASSSVLDGKVQQSISPTINTLTTNIGQTLNNSIFGDALRSVGKRSSTETFDRSVILSGVNNRLDTE